MHSTSQANSFTGSQKYLSYLGEVLKMLLTNLAIVVSFCVEMEPIALLEV